MKPAASGAVRLRPQRQPQGKQTSLPRDAPHGQRVPGGAAVFRRVFTRLGCHGRPPHFVVDFYPYAGLTHTIRLNEDTAYVRLSDLLRGARMPVMEAAAAILVGRLWRRQPPAGLLQAYRGFSLARETRRRIRLVRRTRSRPKCRAKAFLHDLKPLFDRLNRHYFRGRLRRPRLGWSMRPWQTQLGCFDSALDQIVLNTCLDRRDVPQFVVEYVLFHEMLHVKHPIKAARCGFQTHSPAFRREEKRFALYQRAHRFLVGF